MRISVFKCRRKTVVWGRRGGGWDGNWISKEGSELCPTIDPEAVEEETLGREQEQFFLRVRGHWGGRSDAP